jgi:hypothetical protein
LFAFRPVWNSNFTQSEESQVTITPKYSQEKLEKNEPLLVSSMDEDFEKQEIKETMKEEEEEDEKVISSTFSEVNSSMESRYKSKPSKNLVKKKIFQDEIQFSEESDGSQQESSFVPKESINSEDFTEDEEIFSSAPQNKDSSFDDDFGKFFAESKKRKHKEIPSKKKFQKTKIQSVIEREGKIFKCF